MSKSFSVQSPTFPNLQEGFNYEQLQEILEKSNEIRVEASLPPLDVEIVEKDKQITIETDSLNDLVQFSAHIGAVIALAEEESEHEARIAFDD